MKEILEKQIKDFGFPQYLLSIYIYIDIIKQSRYKWEINK